MPHGGSRPKSGRKQTWGEKRTTIGVPESISHDLLIVLRYLWDEKGLRGERLIEHLRSLPFRKIPKYHYPVAAGSDRTSNAGGETEGSDYEDIDLLSELIREPSKTIIIPVVGDSMIGIGINADDWLIVERIEPLFQRPNERDIVIAHVNGEDLVKRFTTKNGKVILVSENPAYEPIEYDEGSIYIFGIVRNVIKRNLSKL